MGCFRYFTKHELRELFQLEEPRFSNTQRQLDEMHGLHRRRDPELDDHIAFLHSLGQWRSQCLSSALIGFVPV